MITKTQQELDEIIWRKKKVIEDLKQEIRDAEVINRAKSIKSNKEVK